MTAKTDRLHVWEWEVIAVIGGLFFALTWLTHSSDFAPSLRQEEASTPSDPPVSILSVLLVGEVEGGLVFLPLLRGTNVEDLLALPLFTEASDPSVLQKKRPLRDKDVFRIPPRATV